VARNMRDISFASFNLYNLQRPGQPMYATSRPYTEEEYAAKIAWKAAQIRALDADVIAFQEVWSREALADLFAAAGLADSHGFAFIKEGAWDGIAVAAAVRRPWRIKAAIRHKDFPEGFVLKKRRRTMAQIRANPTRADTEVIRSPDLDTDPEFLPSHEDDALSVEIAQFSRSPLEVVVEHGTARRPAPPPISVFCTHLKSKLSTRLDIEEFRNPRVRPHQEALGAAISTIRRVAEAAALRIILTARLAGTDTPCVVLGDLNDGQYSATLAVLSGQPSFRLFAASTAGKRSDIGLYTGVAMQQLRSLGDVYYTYEHRNVREVIDHVLVSEQFYEHSEKRLWAFRELRVVNDHVDAPARATTDHGIVRAAFDWLGQRA
jgi:endonuclease/exonuclease/phosphatase family metal-dependent hydrolase